jgi:hypothetical protein
VGDEKRNRNREPTPHSSWEPHSAYRFHQEQLTYRTMNTQLPLAITCPRITPYATRPDAVRPPALLL